MSQEVTVPPTPLGRCGGNGLPQKPPVGVDVAVCFCDRGLQNTAGSAAGRGGGCLIFQPHDLIGWSGIYQDRNWHLLLQCSTAGAPIVDVPAVLPYLYIVVSQSGSFSVTIAMAARTLPWLLPVLRILPQEEPHFSVVL